MIIIKITSIQEFQENIRTRLCPQPCPLSSSIYNSMCHRWKSAMICDSGCYRLKEKKKWHYSDFPQLRLTAHDLYEYPILPNSMKQSWCIRTILQLEKQRYPVLRFQIDNKKIDKDAGKFDDCKLTEIKLFLNSLLYFITWVYDRSSPVNPVV